MGLRILCRRMSAQYKRQLEEELDRVKQREVERSRGYGLER
jgi:hypothetical protein